MQINAGVSQRGFWQLNPMEYFPLFRLTQIAVLSLLLFHFPSRSQAQGNLVNLYNWSNETEVGYDPNPNDYINVASSTSAYFYGNYALNGFAIPILSATLATVPGATYEISFTMEDQNIESCNGEEFFGNTSTDIDLTPAGGNPMNPSPVPINVDFTEIATSATTPMSFEFSLDSSGVASIYNLSVTEVTTAVPEMSTQKLFVFLGVALLCVRKWRRLLQMRNCNLVAGR